MLSEIVIEQQCLKTEHKLCSIIHTTQGSLSTFTVLDRQGIVGNILYLQYRILGLYNLKRDIQYILIFAPTWGIYFFKCYIMCSFQTMIFTTYHMI